jgi:hypothetical protein
MRDVVGLSSEHELGIRRHIDLARPDPLISDRDPPNLGVVFRGDQHFHARAEGPVAAEIFGTVLIECDLVGLRFRGRRLRAGGPHGAADRVAQKDV